MRPTTCCLLAFLSIAGSVRGQWLNYRDPRTPRTANGKPNLSAPAPRAADGKPDLSGVWQVEATPLAELKRLFGDDFNAFDVPGDGSGDVSKYFVNVLADFKPEEAMKLMRPEAGRILAQRSPAATPDAHCLPPGTPLGARIPTAFKMVQASGLIMVAYENPNPVRQIHTDGRKFPPDPEPSWMGYSTGVWNGDSLIVKTSGLNDKSWLDAMGHPHSEQLLFTERYRRRDFGHMDIEMTVDDPAMYTRPFTVKFTVALLPDTDIFEYICAEGEKDLRHLK
jgi:hypothetical protein